MNTLIRIALPAILVLLAACATPRGPSEGQMASALPADGQVSVSWDDPSGFSERYRSQGFHSQVEPKDWMPQLAMHLRRSVAARLGEGQQVRIHIQDVALAGAFEDLQGAELRDVRVLREIYPPIIDLRLDRLAPDGRELGQTAHHLRDVGYLSRHVRRHGRDYLQHEKLMIDDWAKREFPAAR
jgi:hypothetical protein